MTTNHHIDTILAECSTAISDQRRHWPTAIDEWTRLYGLRNQDLAALLNTSTRTVESWRDVSKPRPAKFLIYALRYLEGQLPERQWDVLAFRKRFIKIENNA